MKMLPFLAYTTAGSLLWNTIWILVGRQLGSNWRDAEKWSELIELVALAGMGVVVVVLVIRARRRRA